MITQIKQGDIVKCLCCGRNIAIYSHNFIVTPTGEYIKCGRCKDIRDVQFYHLFGKKVGEDEQ